MEARQKIFTKIAKKLVETFEVPKRLMMIGHHIRWHSMVVAEALNLVQSLDARLEVLKGTSKEAWFESHKELGKQPQKTRSLKKAMKIARKRNLE